MQSTLTKFAAPPRPNYPLFSPLFAGPKISQAQNGFPRLTRLVFRRRLPVQHIIPSLTRVSNQTTQGSIMPHGARQPLWNPSTNSYPPNSYTLLPVPYDRYLREELVGQ